MIKPKRPKSPFTREEVEELRRRNQKWLENPTPLSEKDLALIESLQAKLRGQKPH